MVDKVHIWGISCTHMKRINLTQLRREPLNSLPVVLTKRGEDFAVIVEADLWRDIEKGIASDRVKNMEAVYEDV